MSKSILNKITAKGVWGEVAKNPEAAYNCMTIIGTVNAVRPETSNFGAYFKMSGVFEAVNILTGEVFASGVAILPEPIGSLIGSQLLSMQVKTEREIDAEKIIDGQTVKYKKKVYDPLDAAFAYIIGVKPAKNAFGYQWTASPLAEPTVNDPLVKLREIALKALPAPAPAKDAA